MLLRASNGCVPRFSLPEQAELSASPEAVPARVRSDPRFEPTAAALRAAGCVFAEDEAAILLHTDAERSSTAVGVGSARGLEELVARRIAGEPLEQIVGWVHFAGMRLQVRPGLFVPRRRTTLLAALAVAAVTHAMDSHRRPAEPPVMLEAFCGVGPVASAVAASVPGVDLHLGDVEAEAVECAVANARASAQARGHEAGMTGHRLDCLHGLPEGLRHSLAVIAAVPPYVPDTAVDFLPREARDFEPGTALLGGADGLDLVRRLMSESPDWLSPDGVLLIELGRGQVSDAAVFATAHGLEARSHLGEDGQTNVLEVRRRN